MKKSLLALVLAFTLNATDSVAAGFNCNASNLNHVEFAICKDSELSKLDVQLDFAYSRYVNKLNQLIEESTDSTDYWNAKRKLKYKQREWVKDRNKNYYKDDIVTMYNQRIDQLNYEYQKLRDATNINIGTTRYDVEPSKPSSDGSGEALLILLVFGCIAGMVYYYNQHNPPKTKNNKDSEPTPNNTNDYSKWSKSDLVNHVKFLQQNAVRESNRADYIQEQFDLLKHTNSTNNNDCRVTELEQKLYQANQSIRLANQRINELKNSTGSNAELNHYKKRVAQLNTELDDVRRELDKAKANGNAKTFPIAALFDTVDKADKREIKKRKLALSKIFHPDHGGNVVIMQQVNELAERLSK
ncbi:TPA: hypothetical protein ACX6RJ_002100 [Photobacterium damselae]